MYNCKIKKCVILPGKSAFGMAYRFQWISSFCFSLAVGCVACYRNEVEKISKSRITKKGYEHTFGLGPKWRWTPPLAIPMTTRASKQKRTGEQSGERTTMTLGNTHKGRRAARYKKKNAHAGSGERGKHFVPKGLPCWTRALHPEPLNHLERLKCGFSLLSRLYEAQLDRRRPGPSP